MTDSPPDAPPEPSPEPSSPPRPLSSAEGRTFAAGLGVVVAGLIALTAVWFVNPDDAHLAGAMVMAHLMFGRAAGITFGYTAGLGHAVVIPVNIVVECALVLLAYPLLVAGWSRAATRLRPFQAMMEGTTRMAERYRGQIRRYGVVGLIAFVLIPFWMTGPVVACLIGHLLGLRTWVILAAVLPAAALGVVAWALPLKLFHDKLQDMHDMAPVVLVVVIVLIAVAGPLIRRASRSASRRPPPES